MFTQTKIERFSASLIHRLDAPVEYLSLPNFLIIGSNVIEELGCTLFNVDRIYGWDEYTSSYSFLLFDAGDKPTSGAWKNECLVIYQDISIGYLRLSYSVKSERRQNLHFTTYKSYQFFADISIDGVEWKRYTQGEYGCS